MAEIPIVVGGAITPFINLKKLDKTFKEEYFDYLVVGSGEDALPSLIEALDNNIEPKGIANVFYTKDGKVKSNDLEAINNLDILPYPDFSQFDLDLYLTPKRVLPLQTARGCTWRKCAFCSYHNTYLGSYKTFSIKRVIETIKYLQSMYECSHFEFHDDEFPPGRAKSISEAILNTDLEHIYISMYSRPVDGYNNNNLLRLMRKAGFSLIRWGIESGCQKTLELMKKGTKISTMSQILRKSSENKIANLCFILFGFPGESEKEAQQTIEFLKTHADYIEDIILSVFIMQPYSPIGKNPERWSVDIKKDGTYSTKSGMDYEEVNDFIFKFDKEAMIDSVKITSDKIRYLLPGHNRAFSYFFISGYNLLSNKDLMKCLGERRFNKIFPIILGEVKKINGKTVLLPVNIKKNIFINVSHPEKEKALDRFQEKLFILSDGTLSIENIISAVYKGFKKEKEHRKKYIHKKCTDFFQDIFSKNWGLGFEKSWHRF